MNKPKKLQFGLNIVSKKAKITENSKKNSSIFQAGDEDEEAIQKTSGNGIGIGIVNEEILKIQERTLAKSVKLQKAAMEEDASIFDYDGVYDNLKKEELVQKRLRDGHDPTDPRNKKARYMADLIKSANERKLYLEKASERKLQKQREEEGGEFGHKEEFVTEAYLERQREIKRLEEEQRKLEEKDSDPRKRESNMAGFYRGLLEKAERKGPLVLGDKSMASSTVVVTEKEITVDENDAEKDAEKERQLPAGVVLNDNQEVVDKRQLLTGGLNITTKGKKKQIEEEREREEERLRQEAQAKLDRQRLIEEKKRQELHRQQQGRNRAFIHSQKIAVEREQAEKKEREEAEKRELLTRSTVTKDSVSDAKARYLARKAGDNA